MPVFAPEALEHRSVPEELDGDALQIAEIDQAAAAHLLVVLGQHELAHLRHQEGVRLLTHLVAEELDVAECLLELAAQHRGRVGRAAAREAAREHAAVGRCMPGRRDGHRTSSDGTPAAHHDATTAAASSRLSLGVGIVGWADALLTLPRIDRLLEQTKLLRVRGEPEVGPAASEVGKGAQQAQAPSVKGRALDIDHSRRLVQPTADLNGCLAREREAQHLRGHQAAAAAQEEDAVHERERLPGARRREDDESRTRRVARRLHLRLVQSVACRDTKCEERTIGRACTSRARGLRRRPCPSRSYSSVGGWSASSSSLPLAF